MIFPSSPAAAAGRVLTGEAEYGEKYTEVYAAPEASEAARDDEDFDRYRFSNTWLQYEQALTPQVRVALRTQQLDRAYIDRPLLDNTTRYGQLRLTLEPTERWAVWPHLSLRSRDYDRDVLDNRIVLAGVETRYRWGVRNNVRAGASYTRTRYDNDAARDREAGDFSASLEHPLTESFTLRLGGKLEASSFRVPSASRENATRGSASVGFRYEF